MIAGLLVGPSLAKKTRDIHMTGALKQSAVRLEVATNIPTG
jgi:hypothetical protein